MHDVRVLELQVEHDDSIVVLDKQGRVGRDRLRAVLVWALAFVVPRLMAHATLRRSPLLLLLRLRRVALVDRVVGGEMVSRVVAANPPI